jgi:hypothetical protein
MAEKYDKLFLFLKEKGLSFSVITHPFVIIFVMLMPISSQGAFGQSEDTDLPREKVWQEIQEFFVPPVVYKNDFGTYRSPLLNQDGSKITQAKDWSAQRAKISAKWHGQMGSWPPLITDQPLQILDTMAKDGFTQHTILLQWTPNEVTRGYLLVPNQKGKKPAVITLYYEPETAIGESDNPNRDFALQLARRGFMTLSLGTTEATEAKTYALYYPSLDNATIEPLSMLAYAAANAWHALAHHSEVDSTKIGVVGHSFGGKWAMFASCLFDKFACAVWSDPGIMFQDDRPSINYWEPWYLGYHPQPWRERGLITPENPAQGSYPQMIENGFNLHELHALMAPRPFLISGGSEDQVDRWQALNHTLEINQMLGQQNGVAMTNRPEHSPNEASNRIIYLFFEYFLKP